jgi:hypothetical protein
MREVIIPEMRAEIVRREIGKRRISDSVHILRINVVSGSQKQRPNKKNKTGTEGKF